MEKVMEEFKDFLLRKGISPQSLNSYVVPLKRILERYREKLKKTNIVSRKDLEEAVRAMEENLDFYKETTSEKKYNWNRVLTLAREFLSEEKMNGEGKWKVILTEGGKIIVERVEETRHFVLVSVKGKEVLLNPSLIKRIEKLL